MIPLTWSSVHWNSASSQYNEYLEGDHKIPFMIHTVGKMMWALVCFARHQFYWDGMEVISCILFNLLKYLSMLQ